MRSWAERFLGEIDASPADLGWLLDRDAGAPLPLTDFVVDVKDRYGLDGAVEDIASAVLDGLVGGMVVEPAERAALSAAREAGWTVIIITNGAVATQEYKIRASGLDAMVDGWLVSEAAGVWKPDPRIFERAAAAAGEPLRGAWMIGDNPASDIAGAHQANISSAWVARGRQWTEKAFKPTVISATCADGIRAVLGPP